MLDERTRRVEAILGRRLSRRELLILAAYGGSAAAAAAFIAACSPAASPSASTSAPASAPAGSASAAASVALGRPLKIGYVSPKTGPLAPFAEADDFIFAKVMEAIGDGVGTDGGTTHPIEIIPKDSQSDPNRAAEVALELITDDEIDLMLVASTPETTNPVADQCEQNGIPCVSSVAPWQPYFFGRQPNVAPPDAQPFEWTYHFFWGLEDIIAVFLAMWSQVETNKVVGALWPNDGDGNAWSSPEVGFPPAFTSAGYTLVDPGRYENGTQDFSAQIDAFKRGNVEIVTGVPIPPDWTTFWNQAAQQDFHPKIASVGKALLFPASVDAFGPDLGDGLSSEVWWSPSHPFTSSITASTAADLATDYTTETTKQWTQPIGFAYALFEVAIDVIARATNVDDKAAIRDAIKSTSLDTIVGKVQWTGDPTPNIAKTPLVGGQWKKGGDFNYDLVIVSNDGQTDIQTGGTLDPIPGS
jgi:branched-chain amino acid transport system substrate-binding protein